MIFLEFESGLGLIKRAVSLGQSALGVLVVGLLILAAGRLSELVGDGGGV